MREGEAHKVLGKNDAQKFLSGKGGKKGTLNAAEVRGGEGFEVTVKGRKTETVTPTS